ncbi:hypothetical protein Tco_1523753 [Tanacetum coccineum]
MRSSTNPTSYESTNRLYRQRSKPKGRTVRLKKFRSSIGRATQRTLGGYCSVHPPRVMRSNVDSSGVWPKLTDAVTQVTNVVATIMKQIQAPAPAFIKVVEESCVTCSDAHSYRQCPATDGNTFTGYHDNIQGYVSAAAMNNYNQGYRPQGDPHFYASN